MARANDDSWDLASGVGATATAVAASRALANRAGLIDDAWAEPLVRAVGMEHFQELLDAPENDTSRGEPGGLGRQSVAARLPTLTMHTAQLNAMSLNSSVRLSLYQSAHTSLQQERQDWRHWHGLRVNVCQLICGRHPLD